MKLKEIRKENNLTQEQVADKLKIARTTYASYEQNLATPDIYTLIEYCKLFNISLDYLCDLKIEQNNLTPEQQEMINLFNKLDKNEQQNIIAYLKGLTNQPLTFKKN